MDGDEEVWRRRFLLFVAVRVFGLAFFALGIAIAFTDLLQPGGSPAAGFVIAVLGAVDALFAPRLLKAVWDRE